MSAAHHARRLAIVLSGCCIGAFANPAQAASVEMSRKKAIWGPVEVAGKSQFPIYRDLGVGIYEYALNWPDVAPTRPTNPTDPADPAYVWPADADKAVAESGRYGMRVAMMLIRSPAWARENTPYRLTPDRADSTIPPDDPQDYADFAVAVAKRYPSIHLWQIWGEPNRGGQFAVHYYDSGKARDRVDPLSPAQRTDVRRYAELVDAAYGSLKRLSRRNLVVGGMTAVGDITPLAWIRHLKLVTGKPPRMDLYGHNPYGLRTPKLSSPHNPNPPTRGNADFSDLDTLAGWLDKYLAKSGRNKKLPIFISEYNAPTDGQSFEFNYHVTRAVQAKWLREGLRIARRWSRVYTFGWHSLRDIPANPDSSGLASRTGLIDLRGRRKPSYQAYKRG